MTTSSQQVLSRDSVTVSVDAVVYYRVSNPTMATNNIEDYRFASPPVHYCDVCCSINSCDCDCNVSFQPLHSTAGRHDAPKCAGH